LKSKQNQLKGNIFFSLVDWFLEKQLSPAVNEHFCHIVLIFLRAG